MDPSRLILTFGANTSMQDRIQKNTALHWAVQSKNSNVFNLLVNANASLDIPNEAGETVYAILKKMRHFDWISKTSIERVLSKADRRAVTSFRSDEVIDS